MKKQTVDSLTESINKVEEFVRYRSNELTEFIAWISQCGGTSEDIEAVKCEWFG